MIPVELARQKILDAIDRSPPLASETMPLVKSAGRVLSESLVARVTKPPLAVSAMDGWAVRTEDCQTIPTYLQSVGEVAAGQVPKQKLKAKQTMRIFTGAAIPQGADAVVLQENATITPDGQVEIHSPVQPAQHIRQAGIDFARGDQILTTPRLLTARDLSLAAAANYPDLPVFMRPKIGILSTGSELIAAGQKPKSKAQIINSNSYGLAAIIIASGGSVIDFGIVEDDAAVLEEKIDLAKQVKLQMLVTIGGASVGDYDLVQSVMASRGMVLDFWKIAMRPGKPLIFGQFDEGRLFLGLPGNPVSCYICALIFLRPAIQRFLGIDRPMQKIRATSTMPIKANDERREFQRATLVQSDDQGWQVTPAPRSDSSLHSVLAAADGLIERAPFAAAVVAGEEIEVLLIPPGF
ncbi:MAG: molybdopterin molybdotransferase MoeA [Candidatus Pacebacteria bacterium]|nr:molybdopterin molybdotransferase MoeA [Candidatus Paceibacterota bacterium]